MNTFFSKCVAQGPRDNLEDCCNCLEIANPTDPENSVTVAVVADGVGGHCRGEWASQLAVTHIMSSLAESIIGWMSTGTILDLNQIAQQAFETANQAILQEIRNHPEWTGMATTAVCTLRYRNTLITAWAGDSRAYLFHLGELTRLTKDHKATTPLMAEGLLNPQDERRHPLYHTICQYLGMPEQFQIDLHACHLAYGDIVLLCSDGLTDVISDEEIGAVMVRYNEGQFSLKRLAHYLVELALDSWTRDNVTVLCGEYLPNPPSHSWNETLTGAYPDQVAKILHHSIKEYSNANHQQSLSNTPWLPCLCNRTAKRGKILSSVWADPVDSLNRTVSNNDPAPSIESHSSTASSDSSGQSSRHFGIQKHPSIRTDHPLQLWTVFACTSSILLWVWPCYCRTDTETSLSAHLQRQQAHGPRPYVPSDHPWQIPGLPSLHRRR